MFRTNTLCLRTISLRPLVKPPSSYPLNLITCRRTQSNIASTTASTTQSAPAQPTKRNPTNFTNRVKSLNDSPLIIHNKKYNEAGKLLSLHLSSNAISKLKQLAQEESNPDLALRITVESGGCHGFQYNLHLSDMSTVTEEDCVFEKDTAKVIIDDSSLNILQESTVDYTTELIGSMFKVVNSPYTSSSCGCGSSFDVDFDKIA